MRSASGLAVQLVEQPIGRLNDRRLENCDRARLEGVINEGTQATVLRIVVAQHVRRKKAERPRENFQYPLLRPASGFGGIAREVLAAFQQFCAALMARREPCAADDRQSQAHHRAFGSHAVERRKRAGVELRG
ncbi:hypothetical protein ACVWZR_000089 [Bradyrhizobium sp. i1.3.1]